jgi:hypothetical protein
MLGLVAGEVAPLIAALRQPEADGDGPRRSRIGSWPTPGTTLNH